jgi:ribosomal protein S18 acetylase RimI-like enzyme
MSENPSVQTRVLAAGEENVLHRVAPGVFDNPLDSQRVSEFLSDPRHHIAVAVDDDEVVGMATAVHYVHPDKQPELWINEIGIAPSHRGRGLGKRLLTTLFARGMKYGCRSAWVLTDSKNAAAKGLYASLDGVRSEEETEMYTFRLTDEG